MIKIRYKSAFTLVELLVVIAIIGLIATLSVVALGNARAKSRDTKRVSDIKQVQTALELFYNDQGRYPTIDEWNTGSLYATGTYGATTYMARIPQAPTNSDGDLCNSTTSAYAYSSNSTGDSYTIRTCLGQNTGSYGNGIIIATPGGVAKCGTATAQDRDGNIYNTVQIGSQCWLKQNLNVGTMVNMVFGTPCTQVGGVWSCQTNDSLAEKHCFNNLAANCVSLGGLYNWAEAMNIPSSYNATTYSFSGYHQGLCPIGYHIPSDKEWLILEQYTNSFINSSAAQYPCDYTFAYGYVYNRCADDAGSLPYGAKGVGKSLKAIGKGTGPGVGDDLVGFSDMVVGQIWVSAFNTNYSNYWTSTQNNPWSAWIRGLYYSFSGINRGNYVKGLGFSVRCLKD